MTDRESAANIRERIMVPVRLTAHCKKCGEELRGGEKNRWPHGDDIYYSYCCFSCGDFEITMDEKYPKTVFRFADDPPEEIGL